MTELDMRKSRDFVLHESDYRSICHRVYTLAGIKLGDQKQDLVYSRLTKRLRALSLPDFASYLALLDQPNGSEEVEYMLNALTTNLTSFFREMHHFEHLKDTGLRSVVEQQGHDRSLRIWSSACSTGEEPYTIAMTLLESGVDLNQIDARILATDINTDVVKRAAAGRYDRSILSKCPGSYRSYFQSSSDSGGEVKPKVKKLISFKQLNLLDDWPMKRKFDIVFCRNVLIYFDSKTKAELVNRFVNILKPQGWLYLGHSESASGSHPSLASTGRTIYRKIA